MSVQYIWMLSTASVFISLSSALKCYQCGTGFVASAIWSSRVPESAIQAESCETLENGGSYWASKIMTCSADNICAKIVNFGTRNTTQRGCVPLRISNDYEHEIKCGSMSPTVQGVKYEIENNGGVSCFCDTDLCNSVASLKMEYLVMLISALIHLVCVTKYKKHV